MNTTEAAALMHVEPQTISRKCQTGEIEATKLCGRWIITEEALEAYRQSIYSPNRCLSCGKIYETIRVWPLCHDCQVKRNNAKPLRNERRRTVQNASR